MGVIDGFSAARMLEIENASVVDGLIDTYGNLILSRKDGSSFDAGRVVDVGTPEAIANSIVARDASSRTKFADPVALNDADTMGARNTAIANAINNAGTSANTANAIVKRDANSRASIGNPTAAFHIDNKGSRDTAISTAISAETTARNTAIAAETTARNTAISNEATARSNADASEVTARNTAIAAAIAAKTNILPVDTYGSSTPVTSYPLGTSHMLVSPVAGWANPAQYGGVTTIRPYVEGPGGAVQYWTAYQPGDDKIYYRQWFYAASAWSSWQRIVNKAELDDAVAARVCRLTKAADQWTSPTAGAPDYMHWSTDTFASGMFDGDTAIYPNRNGKWKVTFKARGAASSAAIYGQVRLMGASNSPSENLIQNSIAGPYITATDTFNITNSGSAHFQAFIFSLGSNHQIYSANCLLIAEYLGP